METTNFFSNIATLQLEGNLNITIAKGMDDTWVVSVLLSNKQCGDKAARQIPPLNLKGTVEDLDRGFFSSITQPLQSTSELLINMEAFLKQQEEAKVNSAMEKEKEEKRRKEKEAKEKKYREAMQKADELEKEGKYREAWMKIPDPADYSEQAETIRKRKSALAARFSPDLFGAPDTKPKEVQPQHSNSIAEAETVDETLSQENTDDEVFSDSAHDDAAHDNDNENDY